MKTLILEMRTATDLLADNKPIGLNLAKD